MRSAADGQALPRERRGATRTRAIYLRLAMNNIRNNRQTFVPYMLTCVGTVAMFFILHAIASNPGLSGMRGGSYLMIIMNLGVIVIGIFSAIFLFYTNSFLIKRRKKEFGLYSILGMEKRHVAHVLWWEAAATSLIGLVGGIGAGMLLSQLMFLLLRKILRFTIPMAFTLLPDSFFVTLALFGAIFLVILLNNLRQISLTQPIELLKGGNVGEREPKTRVLLAILGALCLGGGYWIALTTESPLDALLLFFVAVVLVIVGTYMLFTAGSIALLKALRRNKNFYYKSANFTGISGMMYRMKQNAAGLASICILSTAVLVMISGTVSLYIGYDDMMRVMFPRDISVHVYPGEQTDFSQAKRVASELGSVSGIEGNTALDYSYAEVPTMPDGDIYTTQPAYGQDSTLVYVIALEDYNRNSGQSIELAQDEVLLYTDRGTYAHERFRMLDRDYAVKQVLEEHPFSGVDAFFTTNRKIYVTMANQQELEGVLERYSQTGALSTPALSYFYAVDVEGEDAAQMAALSEITTAFGQAGYGVRAQSAAETSEEFFSLYGGLFFLGIFLGALFIMATVLIIYYKQISEGFDDQQRFSIMQKVGMSKQEIRRTIRSQVLLVFFLPLAAAVVHLLAASKMLVKLLSLVSLQNHMLFFLCAAGTVLLFALMYTAVYSLTAKSYYRIVGG